MVSGQLVERLYREIRALRIYEGATEVQKLIIGARAAEVTGQRLTEATDALTRTSTPSRATTCRRATVAGVPVRPARAAVPGAAELRRASCWTAWWRPGRATRLCIQGQGMRWTYAELQAQANRIANVLVREMGLVPGNRVLLRGANNPMLAACWLAVVKAGGIAWAPCRCCAPRS